MRHWLWFLLVLAVPGGVAAQQPKGLPDLSPDLMVVTGFDAANGEVRVKLTQLREQVSQELQVGPNGVVLTETKVVGPYQMERTLKLKECKILEASGKAIAPADYAKHFKSGAAVIVTNDGKPPAQAFMQVLRPDTVIVVGPAVKPDPRIKLPEPPPKAIPAPK
jgi:hypothetical protein